MGIGEFVSKHNKTYYDYDDAGLRQRNMKMW